MTATNTTNTLASHTVVVDQPHTAHPTRASSKAPVPIRESFARDLMAGGMSGIIAKTIGAPIDRVKLLIQTQSINTHLAVKYKNPIDCVARVYKDQGLASFWRGNLANVYRYFPSQAMNFAFKDKYKDFFGKLFLGGPGSKAESGIGLSDKHTRMVVSLLSGGLAGATALFVSYPFDVARTRLAVDVGSGAATTLNPPPTTTTATTTASTTTTSTATTTRQYSGTFQCLRSTYQLEGMRGVYSGFGVSLAGVILFRALYLGGYDIVKDHYEIEHASFLTRFVAAQAVTTVVGTFCFPIDTIKRRLMVQRKILPTTTKSAPSTTTAASNTTNPGTTPKHTTHTTNIAHSTHNTHSTHIPYKSGLDCARRIIVEEGVKGLFAGLSVNLVRGFTGAVLLVAYDDIKKRL